MKIRINNIFINKKTKEKASIKNNERKTRKTINKRYKNLKLKKIYDINEEDTKVSIVESKADNMQIKRRKGYLQDKEEKKELKYKLYYNNLVRNQNKLSRGYYALLIGMFVLGFGSVTLASKTYKLFNTEDYQVYSSIDDFEDGEEVKEVSSIAKQNIETNNKDTIDEVEPKKEEQKVSLTNANVKVSATQNKKENINKKVEVKPLEFSKPLDGEILKAFSNDKVIYSKTLELWKTHDGIDIKADIGTHIKSIERGTVEKVYEDSFYGITIVIDHGQGYKSSYSNLAKETFVSEKQTVVKGQKIGKIGNTAIGEIKDDSHLHFMLFKDSISQDPTNIFK